MTSLVYFSSASENTHRFVKKLCLPAVRIPLLGRDKLLQLETPYVLITPTYGGGTEATAVPKQVIKFLNNKRNRDLIRGVISAGNTNFGSAYCLAGEVIAKKCKVPYLYRFEIMGTTENVNAVRVGLEKFWKTQMVMK